MPQITYKAATYLLSGALFCEALQHVSHPGNPHVPEEPIDSTPAIRTYADACTDSDGQSLILDDV